MDRIDRLMKLADVWCAVRYFHPWISYRPEIDWDGALIAAITNVLTADDEGTFASALASMLDVMCDPVTRVRASERTGASPRNARIPLLPMTRPPESRAHGVVPQNSERHHYVPQPVPMATLRTSLCLAIS